ncbi:MAG: DMT family transporter [Chloroflexota bacterium]|nr:DMT family transporter [Chloroflexota bacterium]
MTRSVLLGSAIVVMAASLFGMLGYVSRGAAEMGMGALPFVAWRAGLATAVLLGVSALAVARGGASLPHPRLLTVDRRYALFAICLCGALLNIAIFAAFLRTTIAVALITFYTFPAMVTLAAARLFGERLDRPRLAALLLSSAGLVLVVLAPALPTGELDIDLIGVGLALFAAVCQAAFILLSVPGFRPMASLHVATYVVAAAVLISVPLLIVLGELPGLLLPLNEARAWPWILAGGVAGAAIPTTAFLAGIGMIGPSRAAILMTFEPVVGVALAGALLGEQPAPLQLVGGAAVLVAAIVLQVAPRAPIPTVPEYIHPV